MPVVQLPAKRREVYYQWKIEREYDGVPHLLEAGYDSDEEFYAGELLFNSPEDAEEYLDDAEMREQAIEEDWVLCRIIYEIVGKVNDSQVAPDPEPVRSRGGGLARAAQAAVVQRDVANGSEPETERPNERGPEGEGG